jgi:hypothetical protein
MLFEPFLNGLGNNLHHIEPVECTKYIKPVVRLSLNPTGYGLFQYLLNSSGRASMCGSLCTDEIGQGRDRLGGSHPVDEEFPEGNSKLITSLF